MKKKLLITLGCSYLRGEGCYDESIFHTSIKINTPEYIRLFDEHREDILNRWHENSLAVRLAKKLNYDKSINFAMGGSSSEGQLKTFIEKIDDYDLDDWDVTVFWYLSEPTRRSPYGDYSIQNLQVDYESELAKALEPHCKWNTIKKFDDAGFLEQLFYLKCGKHIFESKGWNFIYCHSALLNQRHHEMNEFRLDGILFYDWKKTNVWSTLDKSNRSPVCGHPKESGYEILSNDIFQLIKEQKPHLINKNQVINFEWEWNGTPKDFEPLFNNVERTLNTKKSRQIN